jgi:AcrR family transcriptional regulator
MGITERNQKLIEVKKNEIIDGMERALVSKSYESLTIDDVAKEAEYSKKTIYSYFKSKDEIYMDLIIRKFILLNEVLEKAAYESKKKGIDKIEVMGMAYLEFAKTYPDYMQAIINFDANREYDNFEANKTLEHYFKDFDKSYVLLVDTIKEGIVEGSISKETDPISASIILWSSINGFIMLILKKGEYIRDNFNKSIDELFKYNMNMITEFLKIKE